jgi:hypothetical protein
MRGGWVALHRQFTQWEWFEKPEMVQLFIYLLISATHEEMQWRGVTIKRGQIVTSLDKIKAATGLSTSKIRTCLERLKLTNEITSETTNQYRVITICNYDKYQNVGETSDKQEDKQIANKSQANRKQIASAISYNNNNNNITTKKNISLSCTHEEQREKIFKIFFLKNFVNPAAEVQRFYDNFGAQGWRRGNGQKITDVLAVARAWDQEEKEKQRFPLPFIEALREIDSEFESRGWDSLPILRGIERVEFTADMIYLYCGRQAYELIEQSGVASIICTRVKRNLSYKVNKQTN